MRRLVASDLLPAGRPAGQVWAHMSLADQVMGMTISALQSCERLAEAGVG